MNDLRKSFDRPGGVFLDRSGHAARDTNDYWAPIVITKEQIDQEIERLASLPRPANGRRESLIVHPSAPANAPGLAPSIEVKLQVLKPGENTVSFRHNATEVNFCIQGSGRTEVGNRSIAFSQYDVWNHPSFTPYVHHNDGREVQARLTYSNAPLLKNLHIYLPEDEPGPASVYGAGDEGKADPRRVNPFGMIPMGEDGGMLMPYETLINPATVDSRPLHFPWRTVKSELDKLYSLGKEYIGRRLYMMYNPMTGRYNGITPSFFATMTMRPPKIVDRPHRHVSAAINYYFHGSGFSNVAGNRYDWKAGDLMLSAPGWTVHNHASNDIDRVYELTVQDQPLNLYLESLLWQEDMHHPAALLGSQAGFETNRMKAAA
jgi:gentisate 1,2-dioxygenase